MNNIIVKVGLASCGVAAGAKEVYNALKQYLKENDKPVTLKKTACIGMCFEEPIVQFEGSELGSIHIGKARPETIISILEDYIAGKAPAENIILAEKLPSRHNDLLANQQRIVLRNCGIIDPECIEDYEARDGYKALQKALSMDRDAIIDEIKKSGLRGRGGAGFPTGVKWQLCAKEVSAKKYVICNADEGDPGAFMDRSTLEGDPHSVIEGMIIGAYAIGANEGYIYCRAEYPMALEHLKTAIAAAEKKNYLGKNILGSSFSFDLHIKEGAGAFVCGEETALIRSIEGKVGEPRQRPPYPIQKGVWGKPTIINNVETWANIPIIIQNGSADYNAIGTNTSKGTKIFSLVGKIKNTGLVEVPMGITIKEIIYDIGGGSPDRTKIKAIQTGGPSGGCIPISMFDLAIDYDSLAKAGSIMGSGGVVVMDEETCMVDIARFFMDFTQDESCGKCTPCRVGTRRILEILNRICAGEGKDGDLETLDMLCSEIKATSLCGLGQGAPNPVESTLKHFRHEYEAHIYEKRCPAKVCRALIRYEILPDMCTGCTVCARNCPTNAITGERRQPHVIDPDTCVRCGICMQVCNFNAIEIR